VNLLLMKGIYFSMVVSLLFICNISLAQKIEREFRVAKKEFPTRAIDFLKQAKIDLDKVKWFEEIQNDQFFFEAKVKVDKHLFSIKFDSSGNLQDVEKLVVFKEMSVETQNMLSSALKQELGKFKIIKTQIQFTNCEMDKITLNELSAENSIVRYEIELYFKKDTSKKLMEYLISDKGEILSAQEIVIRSTENLTY
jgi:hypothetical protein